MKRHALCLALVLTLLVSVCVPSLSLAAKQRQYIVPDSNTRYLTTEELWGWDYESVGYIFNEIFARHGYNFEPGGQYDAYFRTRGWYTPNANSDNHAACYPQLNKIEWANEKLCKQVRAEMRRQRTSNKQGKNFLDYVEQGTFDVLSGFTYMDLKSGQKLSVYSAPSASSWRGANGKASVSTNGSVYVAGWEKGWLLLMYETNNGGVRVGYAQNPKGKISAPQLDFAYENVACVSKAVLTDDPARESTSLATLAVGTTVTYLASYQNHRNWAYVETTVSGQTARGFIPMDALDLVSGENDEEIPEEELNG